MPCTEIGEIGFYLASRVREFGSRLSWYGHTSQHVSPVIPSKDYTIRLEGYLSTRLEEDSTVPGVSVKHLLDNKELSVPVSLPPTVFIPFVCKSRSIWDVLKAPATVVPYPVDFGVGLEYGHGHRQFVRKQIIHILR